MGLDDMAMEEVASAMKGLVSAIKQGEDRLRSAYDQSQAERVAEEFRKGYIDRATEMMDNKDFSFLRLSAAASRCPTLHTDVASRIIHGADVGYSDHGVVS
jgi:hypothetical protein